MDRTEEYPRPDFDRSHRWLSLNGEWDFAPDPDDRGRAEGWQQIAQGRWSDRIVVPYPWEAPRSGIGQQWLPIGWYQRTIERPPEWAGERTMLHVGAAHYACQVWLNGQEIGTHTGGYLPCSFDITDALRDGQGHLVIRVEAPVDKRFIPHGKQRSRPADDYDSCCFTPSSGIWQPVWLEGRPATAIERLDLRPAADLSAIQVHARVAGPSAERSTLALSLDGQVIESFVVGGNDVDATIPISDPILWSPDNPHLYWVEARLTSSDGEDRVRGYTGLRTCEVRGNRILLNGEPVYLRGVLDQGFWPECGYTAPDGNALRRDVELALAAGYNLVRKHVKFEDPRWLSWADRLGLLVWAEPPCCGRFSQESVSLFEAQLPDWVARDGNHPSIVLWGLYNEEWGLDWRVGTDHDRQAAVARAYDRLRALDDSRPIIDNSGWWHVKTDIVDWHYYDHDLRRWSRTMSLLADDAAAWMHHPFGFDHPYRTRLSVPDQDHADLPLMNGEYGGGTTPAERGWHLRWQTQEMRRHPTLVGYIYTELFDIEHELCGIYTDTRVAKALGCDPAAINAETIIIFDTIPLRPGCDLSTPDGHVQIDVRVSHWGAQPLVGHLAWGWAEAEPAGQAEIAAAPVAVTEPRTIECRLPALVTRGRLNVWVRDHRQRTVATGFLDVVREPIP